MLKAFVPEVGAEVDTDSSRDSKRRRVISPREGEEISSIYAEIVRIRGRDSLEKHRSTSRPHGKSRTVEGALSTASGHSDETNDSREVIYGPAPNPDSEARRKSSLGSAGFFCKVCEERVTSQTEDQHRTSTLHIFNQNLKPSERKVHLDESNKGFQLLRGMGWKLDEGLGMHGRQGRVDPLQTTFKRDKKGLGAGEKLQARVTHFPSHVPSQAMNAPDGKSDAIRAQEELDRTNNNRKRFSDRGQGTRAHYGKDGRGGLIDKGVGEVSRSGGFWGQGTCVGNMVVPDASTSCSENPVKGGVRLEGGRKSAQGVDTGSFMGKRERRRREERQKRKEHKIRLELFSDIPEEFSALLFTG